MNVVRWLLSVPSAVANSPFLIFHGFAVRKLFQLCISSSNGFFSPDEL